MPKTAAAHQPNTLSGDNDVKAYKRRYEAVNKITLEEARRKSASRKYQDFLSLWRLGEYLGWRSPQEQDLNVVRERWKRLRQLHAEKEKK